MDLNNGNALLLQVNAISQAIEDYFAMSAARGIKREIAAEVLDQENERVLRDPRLSAADAIRAAAARLML